MNPNEDQDGSRTHLIERGNTSMEDLLLFPSQSEGTSTEQRNGTQSTPPVIPGQSVNRDAVTSQSASSTPVSQKQPVTVKPRRSPKVFAKPIVAAKKQPSSLIASQTFSIGDGSGDMKDSDASSSSSDESTASSKLRAGRSSIDSSKYRQKSDVKINIDDASIHEAMTIDKRLRASKSIKKKLPNSTALQIESSMEGLLPKVGSDSSLYRIPEGSHSTQSLAAQELDGAGHLGAEDIYDVYVPSGKASNRQGIDFVELDNYLRGMPYVMNDVSSPIDKSKSPPMPYVPFETSPSYIMNLSQTKKYTVYSSELGLCQANQMNRLGKDGLSEVLRRGMFWIDILRPTEYDMKILQKSFKMHPLTVEDILTDETREKAEIFERYLFVCLRTFDSDIQSETFLDPFFIYILVFPEGIISIHHRPISHVKNVVKRVHQAKEYFGISPDWIMYAILDDVVDSFMPHNDIMEMEVDSIDDLVLVLSDADQSDMLRRIGVARKRVTQLLRLLKTKLDIVRTFTKRCPARLKSHTLLYLRDIQDHVIGMVQDLDHFSETLNRSHGNYLAQISIDLTQASNRMNRVMKNLTAGASIVLPLSMIAGIWGMNVPVPGQRDIVAGDLAWFWMIIVSMAGIAVVMMYFGRKNQWF